MNPDEMHLSEEESEPLQMKRVRHRKHRTPKWRKWITKRLNLKRRNFVISLIVIVAVVVIGGFALVTDSVNRVRSSITDLNRVAESFTSKPGTELTLADFSRLQSSVDDLLSNLSTVKQRLVLLQPFRGLSNDINATLVSLEATYNLALAADEMLDGVQPTLFFLVAGDEQGTVAAQISAGERVVELLELGQGAFDRARGLLEAAETSIDSMSLDHLSQDSILNILGLIDYHQQLEAINQILVQAPELLTATLGLDTTQNYLILSQNSDELRPSGGYVSTWGWMTVRDGRIGDYSYRPITDPSLRPPPPNIAEGFEVPDWWLAYDQPIYAAFDGSWYADFPSTARMAMWYYNEGRNERAPVDGVMAIDITGFEYILKALGTVVVPEYGEVVSADDFRPIVYEIRATGQGDDPHKRFLAALYQQIFTDWQTASGDPDVNARLLGAVLQALQEKHIMFSFADEGLNQAVNLLGWSGAQSEAIYHDYLLVADANLGNKSNHSIVRQLTYEANIQPGGTVDSRTTIAYDYSARAAEQDPAVDPRYHGPLRYGNLLQIFVPLNSQLTAGRQALGGVETVNNGTNTDFVARVFVDYDTSARFQVSYTTPPIIEPFGAYQRYRLLLQKQPGTRNDLANVQVTLPGDTAIVSVSPPPAATYNLDRQILEFQIRLTTDQWIEVIYRD